MTKEVADQFPSEQASKAASKDVADQFPSEQASKAASKDVENIIPPAVTGIAVQVAPKVPENVPLLPEGQKVVPTPAPPPALTTDLPTTEPVSVAVEETKSGPVDGAVRDLIGATRLGLPLDLGGDLQYRALLAWRYDRTVIQAVRDRNELQRYPKLPNGGLVRYAYGYIDEVNPERVVPHLAYDVDWRWRVREADVLPRHPLVLQPCIEKAIKESTDDISAFTVVTRARGWYFEGKTFLSLGTMFKNRQVERGFSALSPITKLMGYQLSITMPADDGLLGCASMDAKAPGQWGPNWFPGHSFTGPALQPVYGAFIGLIKFRDWMAGQTELGVGPAGALQPIMPAMIGRRVVIVPTPLAYIKSACALTWYMISKLQYPLKNRFRSGPVRDWDHHLEHVVNGAWVPWDNQWYPVSSLTSIDGPALPTAAGGDPVAVLFVMFEEYPQAGALTLTLPTLPGVPIINLVLDQVLPAFVDIAPTLNYRFAQDAEAELPCIDRALSMLFTYEVASLDLADAVRFWQCQSHVISALDEANGGDWDSCIGPERAEYREWLSAFHLLPSTQRLRRAPPYVPTNMVGAWPGVQFQGGAAPEAATGCCHWELPSYDQLLALAVATRILSPSEQPPTGIDPPQPELLLPWMMVGSNQIGMALDLLLTANGVSRAMLYFVERRRSPNDVLRRIADQQDAAWGRPSRPSSEGTAGMGPALSSMLFSARINVWHPANGVVQVMPRAMVPEPFMGSHTVILARYDVATLGQFCGEAIKLSSSEDVDLTQAGEYRPVLRDDNRIIKDLYIRLPDVSLPTEWAKSWDIPRLALDGLMSEGLGQGRYRTLRLNKLISPTVTEMVPTTIASPLTWGSLLAMPGNPSNVIAFEPSSAWVLTFQRPLGSYELVDATDMGLVVRDRTWAYTPGWYASYKTGYYLAPLGTKWSSYAADSQSYVRRRKFVVPVV